MRSEEEILALVLSVAREDERIRAVLLNGSRANEQIKKDAFQDFDLAFLVTELERFKADSDWIEVFGERIILQMPNSMKIDEQDVESEKNQTTYLMLFTDFNRIDLTLIEVKDKDNHQDSLTKVLLDKDQLFECIPPASDKDYWIRPPSQKAFSDCCNEFWWVSTYVVKGLARAQPLYAKEMLEGPVRKMLMRMLAWSVGIEKGFSINLGNQNRFLQKYVRPEKWNRILSTYPDADLVNIWNSLFEMIDLFHESAQEVAQKMGLKYNLREAENVQAHLRERKNSFYPNK